MTPAASPEAGRATGGKRAPSTAPTWKRMNQGVQTTAEGDRARYGMGDKETQYVGPEHIQENSR